MLNWLATDRNLPQSALDDLSHLVLSVQDCPCPFVLVDVDFELVKQFFVYLFVLVDQG